MIIYLPDVIQAMHTSDVASPTTEVGGSTPPRPIRDTYGLYSVVFSDPSTSNQGIADFGGDFEVVNPFARCTRGPSVWRSGY